MNRLFRSLGSERIRHILVQIRTQFWLLPAVMGAGGFALAALVLSSGIALHQPFQDEVWWLYSGDASTARDLLSTLLSGLLTMTSLVVSMTFVVLSLAANQLGPRLITIITGDRRIQTSLGVFLFTIVYILLILRSLEDSLGKDGVPHLAVTVAMGLTLFCLIVLLLYMHKIARSLISDVIVHQVADELAGAIEHLPERGSSPPPSPELTSEPHPIELGKAGYIQTIDYDALVRIARDHDVLIKVLVRPGSFVLRHGRHLEVHAKAVEPRLAEQIRGVFSVGSARSPAQDIEYSVHHLVETALRALSSGIKDPFTVMAVLDQLGAALEQLFARGGAPPSCFMDEKGEPRVIADRVDVRSLVAAAFDPIRQGGADDPAILIHLAVTTGKLGGTTDRDEIRSLLNGHLHTLAETAEARISIKADLAAVLREIERAKALVRSGRRRSGPSGDLRGSR